MEDTSKDRCTEFKDILKEHVDDLKSDMLEEDTDSSLEAGKSEIDVNETNENTDTCDETITTNLPEQTSNGTDAECLMLCGRILRVMGDEATCRACGKSLRNIGDEIFCNYATRNILNSLLIDLSERRTHPESVR